VFGEGRGRRHGHLPRESVISTEVGAVDAVVDFVVGSALACCIRVDRLIFRPPAGRAMVRLTHGPNGLLLWPAPAVLGAGRPSSHPFAGARVAAWAELTTGPRVWP